MLRKAEREAMKPLLQGPLADALERFEALVKKLKADPQVVLLAYFCRYSGRSYTRKVFTCFAPVACSMRLTSVSSSIAQPSSPAW